MEEIWYKNPSVLIDLDKMTKFFPNEDMTKAEKLNSVVRFSLYLSVLLFMSDNNFNNFYILFVVLGFTYFMYSNSKYGGEESSVDTTKYTYTTLNNPMKNILVNEMGTDKPVAYKGDDDKNEIKNNLNNKLHRKVEDICNNQHSQRQWYTMPNETEGDFARWLYDKPSCKSGDKQTCVDDIEFRYNFR